MQTTDRRRRPPSRCSLPPAITLVLAAALALTFAAAPVAGGHDAASTREALETVVWRAEPAPSTPQGEALFMVRQTPGCLAARLHLRTASLGLVSLSYSYALRSGELVTVFRDELNGWSAREERQLALRFADSAEALDQPSFLAQVAEVVDRGAVPVPAVRLATSDGLRFGVEVDDPEVTPEEALQQGIEIEGLGPRLYRSAPVGTLGLLREVRTLVCDAAGKGRFCVFANVLGTLDQALTRAAPPADRRPPLRDAEGIVVRSAQEIAFDADDLQFLGLFPGFEPRDPLAGTCASSPARSG